jgi:EthD domain
MIKLVFCLRRLPTLSAPEFHRYWVEDHAELVRQHAPTLRIRRYTQNHTFSDPRLSPAIEARGGQIDPFDGVAELWWDSVEDLFEARCTAEGQIAGRALLSDERTFIDLPNSPLFFTNEHLIIST